MESKQVVGCLCVYVWRLTDTNLMLVDVPSFRCGTVPVKKSGKEKRHTGQSLWAIVYGQCAKVCVHCSTFLLFFFSSSFFLLAC